VNATIKLSAPATHEFWEIPVLYDDAHLLALDKPSGLLSVPDHAQPDRPSLMTLLHAGIERGAPWAAAASLTYLRPAHRLDCETTGVLLLARTKPVLIALLNLFGMDKPGRIHVALVRGAPAEAQFTLEAKLAPIHRPLGTPASLPASGESASLPAGMPALPVAQFRGEAREEGLEPARPTRVGLMRIDPRRGKRSLTNFAVRERFSGFTLLQCELLTDRPQQVRAHLHSLRLPVVGDALYGGKPLWLSRLKRDYRLKPGHTERPLIAQPALHAESLTLPHPVTGAPLTITAPWPKDLTVAVKYLRRYAPDTPATPGCA
jgi:23S rRNA-/tRNA-specific pseudouridylate synthase